MADLGQVTLRDLANVLAVVAVFGKRRRLAQQFLGARTHRDREILDLLARVVVIELARHRVALRREQAADRIAQRRLPAMADVQRTRRVGGYEFDHHRLAQMRARQAERIEFGEHPRDNRLPRRRRQHDVDEARAGDVDALDELRGGERGNERFRKLPRIALRALGERQCDARRVVAVRGLLRPVEHDGHSGVLGHHGAHRCRQRAFEFCFRIGHWRDGDAQSE